MNVKEVYQFWKDLPGWAKGTLAIAGAAGAYILITKVSASIAQYKQSQKNLATAGDAVNSLNNLAAQGELPTFDDTQFLSWSQELVTAMSGCQTNHATLESVFSAINNAADLYKLIAVFGSQQVAGCTVLFIPFTSGGAYSLPAAISQYVSSDEKQTLNGILASKGISYTFS